MDITIHADSIGHSFSGRWRSPDPQIKELVFMSLCSKNTNLPVPRCQVVLGNKSGKRTTHNIHPCVLERLPDLTAESKIINHTYWMLAEAKSVRVVSNGPSTL